MSALNPIEHLKAATQRAQRLLANDLKAIPEEKHNHCPGGCAKSALMIVAECAAVNRMVAGFLTTGQINRPPREEREAFLKSFHTQEQTLTFLEEATQELLTALEALDLDTLGEVSDAPLGRPMSRFALAELPAMHMNYHDGQLNYIQSLHGDAEMHWG